MSELGQLITSLACSPESLLYVLDAEAVMPAKAPYYESRFIRANNPDRPQALWLRSTLLLPTAGAPVADAWVMVFDPDGAGNRALKEPYPIDQSDYGYNTWTARIGATTIDDRCAQGSVTGACRSARWHLRITSGGEKPVKLLSDRGYKAKFPTAKTMVRHPLARFDGSLELDDVRGAADQEWALDQLRTTALASLNGRTSVAAWRERPSTYAICTEDQAIHPALQRVLAGNCTTTVEWSTSHSPFLSRPDLVADLLVGLARRQPSRAAH